MRLRSFTSPDAILRIPEEVATTQHGTFPITPPVIFMLTGNPGLIGYYHEYLDILAKPTDESQNSNSTCSDEFSDTDHKTQSHEQCVVAGFTLGGFEVDIDQDNVQSQNPTQTSGNNKVAQQVASGHDDREMIQQLSFPPNYTKKPLYSLNDQIELSYARLQHLCQQLQKHYHHRPAQTDTQTASTLVKVILAGHSVGAYIALEMVRLHHERFVQEQSTPSSTSSSSSSDSRNDHQRTLPFEIVSAFLLTPTIIDLAKSSSGRIASPLLSNIPFFPSLLQYFSNGLGVLLPRAYVEWVVHTVTGMRRGGDGLRTTVAFLLSRGGVKQALHMAGDELRDMGSNKWGAEVWGSTAMMLSESERPLVETDNANMEEKKWQAPRLFFLFAAQDHWVADVTRDYIVEEICNAKQGKNADGNKVSENSGSPVAIVDQETGLVHAWCLEQTAFVARISKQWIAQSLSSVG